VEFVERVRVDEDLEMEVVIVDKPDKKKAVMECLKTGRLFTIRELRKCASKRMPVSEKIVSEILLELYQRGEVVNYKKRWLYAPALDPFHPWPES